MSFFHTNTLHLANHPFLTKTVLMENHNRASFSLFLCAIGFVAVYQTFGFFGHYGFDDMLYAEIAKKLTDGITVYDDSFSYRFPILLFTALSYSIFGVSDFSSSLPSLFITFSTLYIVFNTLRRYGNIQTIFGLTLTVLMNIFLSYSVKIMPDMYVAFFVLLSVYWIDQYKFQIRKNEGLYAFLFSFSVFLAFSSKETAVLFLPLPAILLAIDGYHRRHLKFWGYAILSGTLIFSVYLGIIWLLTGDLFTRFKVLTAVHEAQSYAYSYDAQPISVLLKRLTKDLLHAYTVEGVLLSFVCVLPLFFNKAWRKCLSIDDTKSLYAAASILLLLSANFMTISPFSYHPVPTDPRHTLFLIPIFAIAASFSLKSFVVDKNSGYTLLIALVALSLYAYFVHKSMFFSLYLPMLMLFILYKILNKRSDFYKAGFIVLFIGIMAINPYKYFKYCYSSVKYNLQKTIVFDHFIDPNEPCVVYTDPMQKNIGTYYLGFHESKHCTFVDYTKLTERDVSKEGKKYIFLNYHSQYYSNCFDRMPFFTTHIDSFYILQFEDKKQGIYIYEIPSVDIPEISSEQLLETKNGFESPTPNWTDTDAQWIRPTTFTGKNSAVLPEYSTTYTLDLNEALLDTIQNLYISTEFSVNFGTNPSANLVFSMEDQEGVYFWEGKKFQDEIRVLGKWYTIQQYLLIEKKGMKKNSKLKIYLWNPNHNEALIADFKIRFFDYHLK